MMNYEFQNQAVNGTIELPSSQIFEVHSSDVSISAAFAEPLGLPPLYECVVAGDRVVLALDPWTPNLPAIVTATWQQLHSRDQNLDITFMLPVDPTGASWTNFVDQLPVHIRSQAVIRIHDPSDQQQLRYLASTASGERIYVADCVVDADLLIPIGCGRFDPFYGYFSASQPIFPALAEQDMLQRTFVPQTVFSEPQDHRFFRELTAEVSWLLGTQFAIQAVPDSSGDIEKIFVGTPEAVETGAQNHLNTTWRIPSEVSAQIVVMTVPDGPSQVAWDRLATTLLNARQLVDDGGRIVVIGSLPVPESPALRVLRRSRELQDLIKPFREDPTWDAHAAISLLQAQQQATVLFWSDLPEEVCDELGCEFLASAEELQRLIDQASHCRIVAGACYGFVSSK